MKTDKLSKYLSHGICPICDKKSSFAFGSFVQNNKDNTKKRVVYCLECKGSFEEISEVTGLKKK